MVFNWLIQQRIDEESKGWAGCGWVARSGRMAGFFAGLPGSFPVLPVLAAAANRAWARRRRGRHKFIYRLDSERERGFLWELPVWRHLDIQLTVEKTMRLCCKAAEPAPVGNSGGYRCSIVLCLRH
jgi:hypothetical protein